MRITCLHHPGRPLSRNIFTRSFSPNSVLLGVLNAFLRCPPWCWMVRPPSRGLVPPCLPLSPLVSHCLPLWHMCACVGRCVRLRRSCLPIVSLHMCACVGWCVCLRKAVLSPLVPRCLPMLPVTPIVSQCPRLSTHMCATVGWCVRLPEVCLCWMVCPHSRPLVSQLVSHCLPTCVTGSFCLPLPPHVFPCLALSPFLFPFVGWCVGLSEACLPLSPIVSHYLPTCMPVLNGVSAFACLPFSPHMCAYVVWCVRLPEVLPPLVSPTWVPVLCVRLSEVVPPLVSHCLPYMRARVGWCVSLPLVCHSPHMC